MNQDIINQIRTYLESEKENIIADLFSLVRFPSIQDKPAPHAPFGKACRDALDAGVALFQREGLESAVYADGKYGLAKQAGQGTTEIGIFTHLDVVPVTDDWMLTSPFAPIVHEGCLVGRGIHDNKAGAIMALYALKASKALGIPLKSQVTVFLGANEETGMEDIEAYVAEQPMPTVSLVPDNAYPICLGEKGIYHLFARSNQPFSSIISIEGGVAVNVILDKVTARIKPSSVLYEELSQMAKGNDKYEVSCTESEIIVVAHGITSHGSAPQGSLNAGKMLLRLLTSVPHLHPDDKAILSSALCWLEDDYGKPFGISADDLYFGKTTATNGLMLTKEGHLLLSFDIRYGSVSSPEWVQKNVQNAICLGHFTPVHEENRPGFRIPAEEPTAQALMAAYRMVSEDYISQVMHSGGGTYARHLKHAFSCGCEAPYKRKKLDLPQGHGDIHQSDESISIEGLMESITLFTTMLFSLDETL